MASPDVQRKLTAILCADVVGYSRLMGENETATLRTLTNYRQVFADSIEKFRGRIVNAPGDSILAEFTSVVDGVECAAEIQRELAERNGEMLENRQMQFRIGINLGDVLVQSEDLYGDGVNIAARLESLADPGGICISESVHDQVEKRLPLHFDFLGEQKVKNIAKPVKTYKVLTKPGDAAHRVVRARKALTGQWRRPTLAVIALLVIGGGGYWAWNYQEQKAFQAAVAQFEQEAILPLPDKPSIAVLAFDNMSGDPEQENFSDGISEDIITDLSKISGILVIARNSSFTYKGKPVDVTEVASKLGVRYVLEGSVRRAKDQVRVSTQLIDAQSGNHVWAERYDRKMKEIFALQDDITEKIVSALEVQLSVGEIERIRLNTTSNWKAWGLYRRGMNQFHKFTPDGLITAKEMLLKSLQIDPEFEAAMLGLGLVRSFMVKYSGSGGDASLRAASEYADRAAKKDDRLADIYVLRGFIHLVRAQHGQAITNYERAIALEPSNADAYAFLAEVSSLSGKTEKAARAIKSAMQLNPTPPDLYFYTLGMVHYYAERPEEATLVLKELLSRNPNWLTASLFLIASTAASGRLEEARSLGEKFRNKKWKMTYNESQIVPSQMVKRMRYLGPAARQRLLRDLSIAGIIPD